MLKIKKLLKQYSKNRSDMTLDDIYVVPLPEPTEKGYSFEERCKAPGCGCLIHRDFRLPNVSFILECACGYKGVIKVVDNVVIDDPELHEECRDNEVPCDNRECPFLDSNYEQHCSGELNGHPAVATCKLYKPVE